MASTPEVRFPDPLRKWKLRKVLATTPGWDGGKAYAAAFIDCSGIWSDRNKAEEGGNITAISIKKCSSSIGSIRTR